MFLQWHDRKCKCPSIIRQSVRLSFTHTGMTATKPSSRWTLLSVCLLHINMTAPAPNAFLQHARHPKYNTFAPTTATLPSLFPTPHPNPPYPNWHPPPTPRYSIMRQCWQEQPSSRPTFSELSQWFDRMLQSGSEYLDLSTPMVLNREYFDLLSDGGVLVVKQVLLYARMRVCY